MNLIASLDSSKTGINITAESNVGVTPANAVGYALEITGESLNNTRQTQVSQSFRADRQVPGVGETGETSTGTLNTELKFSPITDTLIEAVLQGTWTSNVVTNGTTRRTFTIEKYFPDAVGYKSHAFPGAEFTELAVSVKTGSFVTVNYGTTSRGYDKHANSVMNSIVQPLTTNFMTAVAEGVTFKINDVDYTGGVTDFDFTLNNGARDQRQIGSVDLAGIGMGRSATTGTLKAYFNGQNALSNAYDAHQTVKIEIGLPDTDGNKYTFTFYKVFLDSATVVASGLDQDVMMDVSWTAMLSGGAGSTISVTREYA